MHMVVRLCCSDDRLGCRADRAERFSKPVPGSVSTIIRSFKSEATRQVRLMLGKRVALWQPRFDDRSLSDEAALERARRYIQDNPARWRIHAPGREHRAFEAIELGGGCELARPVDEDDTNE